MDVSIYSTNFTPKWSIKDKKMLIIIVGPSGSGKTTMQAKLAKELNAHIVVSTTTRDKRDGEVNGIDYDFKSENEINLGDFIEYDRFNGSTYGTEEKNLNISEKHDSIAVVTPNGAKALDKWCYEQGIKTCVINLELSMDKCTENMISRGDSKDKVSSRLKDDNISKDVLSLNLNIDLTYRDFSEYENVIKDIQFIKNANKNLNRMIEIRDNLNPQSTNILVGNNASGKSFLRKQLGIKLIQNGYICRSVSMQTRTQVNEDAGALKSALMDDATDATSQSTVNLIKHLFKSIRNENPKKTFLIIDEPEIGLSKESTLMISEFIKKEVERIGCGLLIITHSDIVLNVFSESSTFWSIDEKYKSVKEYVEREIIATDISFFEKNPLFHIIENRLKRAKEYN